MFSNFLYFLIALVIYSGADLFEAPLHVDVKGLYYGLLLSGAFVLLCRFSFLRLERTRIKHALASMDQRVSKNISRLSIAALAVFIADIYLFNINHLLLTFSFFRLVPTLGALVFLGIFLFYLVVIWDSAYRYQKRHFPGVVSKKSFIFSNIAFALPALLPWFCLSLFADMVEFLPFEPVKIYFNSPVGEAVYILVFMSLVAVFGPVLIRRLWGCRPLERGWSRTKIEQVCERAGLTYDDILRWDLFGGSMITAGVMGIIGRYRYILVTDALLNALDDEEIEGVMLHEIGHVRYRHMLYYLVFFLGFVACNFVFFEPAGMLLYVASPIYSAFEMIGIAKGTAYPLMICLGLILFFILYFRFGFGFLMRNFERQADLHIFAHKSGPSALISTFYKIASLSRQSIDAPNWHHYSIGRRIWFLERCRENPSLVDRHHRRVRRIMTGYVLVVFLIFSLGYAVAYGPLKTPFERFIAEEVLAQQLAIDPANAGLYTFVGDYYYDIEQYAKAKDAYENVLRIDSENVHALNNLAWLLATCPDIDLRDGARSLALAQNALALKREAYILDTYAEALFLNRRLEDAVDAAREALLLAQDRQHYYREQVQRFERAIRGS